MAAAPIQDPVWTHVRRSLDVLGRSVERARCAPDRHGPRARYVCQRTLMSQRALRPAETGESLWAALCILPYGIHAECRARTLTEPSK